MPMPDPRQYRNMPDPRDFGFGPTPMPDPRQYRNMPDPGFYGDRGFDIDNFLEKGMQEALPMAYVPGDDYGSYIGDSVLGMDELGGQYDPMDEYEFDKDLFDFRIRTPGLDDIMPNYNRGGIASLMR